MLAENAELIINAAEWLARALSFSID